MEDKEKIEELYERIWQLEKEKIELEERNSKAIDNLEKSIESINNKLSDKEIRCENGRIVNPPNDYIITRLKAFRTKSKEILKILKGENNENKN